MGNYWVGFVRLEVNVLCFVVLIRGGQKTVEPDPPDQSGRPTRLPARPLAYIQTDTDTDILNIRITDG